jgi:hypothetical protein
VSDQLKPGKFSGSMTRCPESTSLLSRWRRYAPDRPLALPVSATALHACRLWSSRAQSATAHQRRAGHRSGQSGRAHPSNGKGPSTAPYLDLDSGFDKLPSNSGWCRSRLSS